MKLSEKRRTDQYGHALSGSSNKHYPPALPPTPHRPLKMTENIPPRSSSKTAVTPSESTARGLPYYEKLRRDLRDTIQKKRILDKNMVRPHLDLPRYTPSQTPPTHPAIYATHE